MIIHLDSNFRNRALYPNPSSYAIEINGTPPPNVFIKDGRGCFLTFNQVIFSFYYFKKSPIIPFTSYSNNSIVIDVIQVPNFQTYLQVYSTICQNYFVGYIVQDQKTMKSSTIRLSFRDENKFTLILENSITKESVGNLVLINPSLNLGNNLLINGYSIFNQIPNVGYYFNDGINNLSIIFNLTKGLETNILTVDKPYRNITFNPKSKNSQKPFTVENGDYIIVLNNRQEKEQITSISFEVLDLYPTGLKNFTIVSENFFPDAVKVGDVFESEYGINTNSVFRKINDYFQITERALISSGPKKMLLRVDKIINDKIVYIIVNPGNEIDRYKEYTFSKVGDPDKILVIRSTWTSFSVKVKENAEFLNGKNFMVYFITFFVSVPFYSVITGVQANLLFLENFPFLNINDIYIDNDSIVIYNRIGCLQYFSFFPNLAMPLANTQNSCYQVRLSSISLPNLPLCGTKFLLADFPYILVTFGNLTSTNAEGRSGTNNIGTIWSNNPNANSATFMCAIANIRSPDIIKFVVIRSAQVVTLKLNLGENLRFSVFLPNGTLIRYSQRFEINPQGQSFTPSLSCNDDMSLTQTGNTENTKVFSYIDELSISATFILNQLS